LHADGQSGPLGFHLVLTAYNLGYAQHKIKKQVIAIWQARLKHLAVFLLFIFGFCSDILLKLKNEFIPT